MVLRLFVKAHGIRHLSCNELSMVTSLPVALVLHCHERGGLLPGAATTTQGKDKTRPRHSVQCRQSTDPARSASNQDFWLNTEQVSLGTQHQQACNTLDVASVLNKIHGSGATEASRLLTVDATVASHNGLALELIHRSALQQNYEKTEHRKLLLESLQRDEQRLESIRKHMDFATREDHAVSRPEDINGPVTSGLMFGSGEYFVRLGVGTPAKAMYMVVDTGSDIPWLQCAPCKHCYKQFDPIFDPKNSSSFQRVSCSSQLCRQLLEIHGCSKGSHCLYEVTYGDGSFTMGDFANETFSFDTGNTVLNVAFGCGYDNEGLFAGAGGLLGLGGGKLSFASQVGSSYGKKFSYCLVNRNNLSTRSSSTLIFGANAFPTGSSFTPLLRNPKLDTFYYAAMVGVSIGGTLLPIPSNAFKLSESGTGGVIIDSGTSVTRLPTTVYATMRDAFRNGTQKLPSASKFSLFDTCYNFSKLQTVDVPTVVLHFQNGADLQLPPTNYMVPVDTSGTFCFAFAPTSMDLSIIGNIQQQSFRVGFDTQGYRIAFTPQQCK